MGKCQYYWENESTWLWSSFVIKYWSVDCYIRRNKTTNAGVGIFIFIIGFVLSDINVKVNKVLDSSDPYFNILALLFIAFGIGIFVLAIIGFVVGDK